MAYEKQNFVSGQTLKASDMNRIEDAIVANETEIAGKQPKGNYLTEHQQLKTINGQSVVGEGNIDIESGTCGTASAVNYDLTVKAINHRGYNKGAPENTIPAYILSKKNGFTYVEYPKDNNNR